MNNKLLYDNNNRNERTNHIKDLTVVVSICHISGGKEMYL